MKYVQNQAFQTLEEKKSKFIAYLCPYNSFNQLMERLKEEHPKARHYVYAYRYLNEFDQVVENCSDDGEPKGTSGRPSLNVLAGQELINTGVIIVRYFGGIKLGTGGLVRAYSDAVNLVINHASLKEYKKLHKKILECEYSELSKIEYLIEQEQIGVENKIFDSKVKLILEASTQEFEQLESLLPREIKLI
jgi:uncharacterized YigZ family protein